MVASLCFLGDVEFPGAECFCYTNITLVREWNNKGSIFKMDVWRVVLVLLLSVAVPSYGLGAVGRHDNCPVWAHAAGAGKTIEIRYVGHLTPWHRRPRL